MQVDRCLVNVRLLCGSLKNRLSSHSLSVAKSETNFASVYLLLSKGAKRTPGRTFASLFCAVNLTVRSYNNSLLTKLVLSRCRGYYTAARIYECYFRVVKYCF